MVRTVLTTNAGRSLSLKKSDINVECKPHSNHVAKKKIGQTHEFENELVPTRNGYTFSQMLESRRL